MLKLNELLRCKTPSAWIEAAIAQTDILLIDHAHCEKKAASSALSLIYRYVDKPALLQKMSRLAREELRHFEIVLKIMTQRGIAFTYLEPCSYADGMRQHMYAHEPLKLVDHLLICALIEARSCERFAALVPHLDIELAEFYNSLLAAEARHFENFLILAQQYSPTPIQERLNFFADLEGELILKPDSVFRFHSGIPTCAFA